MTDRVDNFNRADGAIGTPSDGGSAWSQDVGTNWAIATNQATESAAVISNGIATLEASNANVTVQATFSVLASSVNAQMGLAARFADSNNHIFIFLTPSTNNIKLAKFVASAFTQVGTYTGTFVNGDVIALECLSSNTINVYQNGVSRISGSITEGSTNTKHGLWFNCNSGPDNVRWDDFSITGPAVSGTSGPAIMGSMLMVNP